MLNRIINRLKINAESLRNKPTALHAMQLVKMQFAIRFSIGTLYKETSARVYECSMQVCEKNLLKVALNP